jgi:hypothetical protein
MVMIRFRFLGSLGCHVWQQFDVPREQWHLVVCTITFASKFTMNIHEETSIVKG